MAKGVAESSGVTSHISLILIVFVFFAEGDPREWPGPRVWPIFVSTGAFFSMLAFFQALQYL